jgi:alkylation response protein AidB-like acyl-CoA dehydrogenase
MDHPSNNSDQAHPEPLEDQDEEMLIDTSDMSDEKRAALEVAEGARDNSSEKESFGRQLFMGVFRPELLYPFPEQSDEEAKVGDELLGKVIPFLKEHLDPEEVDEKCDVPEHIVKGLAEMGLFAMKVPKEYGGLGLSQVNYNRVMAAIASYCGSTAVLLSAHQSIGVPQPLKLFGTEEQKRRYLPRFKDGAISAFALTEIDVGSDPAKMTTEATLSEDGDHYLISGTKLYTTNGPIADLLVVMAKTAPKIVRGKEMAQISAFIVEGNSPGIKLKHRCDFMGIRGIHNGLMEFDQVKVPKENLLVGEGKGLKLALATLNTGRLTLPAACAGMGRQCLSIVRRWGNMRVQWGLPVGYHENGRQKISQIARSTFAMEAVAWLTSHWADRDDLDIRIEAAMAKLFCTEECWSVVDTAMQFRGGRGYEKAKSLKERGEDPWPIERMMRESRINTIIEGTSDIMRLFLAREAMDPHLKVAADLLKRHTPTGDKIKAGMKLASYYGTWYPSQWVNKSLWSSYEELEELSDHFHYVDSTCHRLARSIFHAMGMHREKLERRQNLLGRLMDIGTELFAMSAVCSYAMHLKGKNPDAVDLADNWCTHARKKVERLFDDLHNNQDRMDNKMAKDVLEGKFKWMENDIVPIGKELEDAE